MYWLYDSWDAIIDFLYLGGNVLRWIAVTIFFMWVLILERLMYFRSTMAELATDIKSNWEPCFNRSINMNEQSMPDQFKALPGSEIAYNISF